MMLWMAPMLGFTEYHFRNTYCRHFSGIDAAIMPFVTLVEGKRVKTDHIKDVWKENNNVSIRLVPQILGNDSDMFVTMIHALAQMGYDEVNWNLGCPASRVAAHKHGSGLLPFPARIDNILEKVFTVSPLAISIKLRLGYKSSDDIFEIIKILNRYPLKSVCLHPRIGIQMYAEKANFELFKKIEPSIHHAIIYNGDIFTNDDFQSKKNECHQIEQWMIGRGIFWDPFLPEKINNNYNETKISAKERFENFNKELFYAVIQRSLIERNALNKMKEYWKYFHKQYEEYQEVFDIVKMCESLIEMEKVFTYIYDYKKFK